MNNKILILIVFLIFINSVIKATYIYMKPFTNQQCSGESEGVGYLFNVINDGECISFNNNILNNLTSVHNSNNNKDSNQINNSNNNSVKVSIYGLIGLFEFYDNNNCTTDSNQYSDAFKHNQCYQLPPVLNVNQNSEQQLYFVISFINDVDLLQPILSQEYGLKKIQYSSINNNNSCQGNNFEFAQFVSNNYNITINNNSNNQIDTIFCDNQKPTIQQCINNQCSNQSLYLNCINNNNNNNNNIVQTC